MTAHPATTDAPHIVGAWKCGAPVVLKRFGPRLANALARCLPLRRHRMVGAKPLLSITFDDFPDSAHRIGAPILERFGLRGTFFTATALLGQSSPLWTVASADAVIDLHGRGHEIGLHTHEHRRLPDMSRADFARDLDANRAALRALLPDLRAETFAYPFGVANLGNKHLLSRQVRASRSAHPGINAGVVDLDYVRAVELIDVRLDAAMLHSLLNETVARHGWLVLMTHDVADRPTRYGASPALLTAAIEAALRRGIDIVPFGAGLDRIGVKAMAT